MSILWNGDVTLCCYDYNGSNVIGNIGNNSMEEIWHSVKIEQIRDTFKNHTTNTLSLCNKCFLAPHNFSKEIPFYLKAWQEEQHFVNLILESRQSLEVS